MPKIRTVGLATRADPDRPVGVSTRTAFISCIQRGWPSMSARTSQTRSIGRIDDDHRWIGSGAVALRRLGEEAVDGIADARSRRSRAGSDRTAADHRITVRHIVTPAVAISSSARVAVARLEVHGRDRVGEDRRLEAEARGIEGRRLDAVVGRQAAPRRRARCRRRAAAASSSVGVVSPVTGSRIVKPE